MAEHDLNAQLQQLREHLNQTTPLTEAERESLLALAQDITTSLKGGYPIHQHQSLVDTLNLQVERFEVDHPALSSTLRNIIQALGNMGI